MLGRLLGGRSCGGGGETAERDVWIAAVTRVVCGRLLGFGYCSHAICSCWGVDVGGDEGWADDAVTTSAIWQLLEGVYDVRGCESAETNLSDDAVAMLFGSCLGGVGMLGSETAETNLRDDAVTPAICSCWGVRCWGRARLRRRICGRCCYHAIWQAVGGRCWGSETAETNLRTLLLACYLQLLGGRCWGSETAETNLRTLLLRMLFAAVGGRCWGARLRRRICGRCCLHAICRLLGVDVGERDCGDESADDAVTMLFGSCWGGRCWGRRDCGDELADASVSMLFAAVGGRCWGGETAETNLRTMLLPMLFGRLLGVRCWGARLRRRICGRCCLHAICAAVGGRCLGSETAETNLRTMLFPCYLQAVGG